MKKQIKIGLALLTILILSSCKKDPYAQFDYTIVCSDMLLQYATPTVSYTDERGQTITKVLTSEYWSEGDGRDKYSTKIEIISGGDNSARKHWKVPSVMYDDFSFANSEIVVTYTPKPDVAPDSVIMLRGGLSHEILYDVTLRDDDGDMHYDLDRNRITNTTIISITTHQKSLNLVEYINDMKDHYKIHAESNGTISVEK